MDMKRVSTGIKGLDRLIGGYPKGRSVLITGKAEGMEEQFLSCISLIDAAPMVKRRHTSESMNARRMFFEQASQFGWDFASYESSGYLKFYAIPEERIAGEKCQFGLYQRSRFRRSHRSFRTWHVESRDR